MSAAFIQAGNLGHFVHIVIATPVVSAFKKLFYLKVFRSPNGNFLPLLDSGERVHF
jgi:hypothetical protein